jgi:hypothetical protein
MAAAFSAVSDSELARMTDRAYREASRSWREAQRCGERSIRPMLTASAASADAFWRDLRDEQDRRLDELAADLPFEVPSTDSRQVPVTSSWIKRCAAKTLPSHPRGNR